MKKENFKIGTTVYFMTLNKPSSGEITAIVEIEGKVKLDYTNFDTAKGEKETIYYVNYSQIKACEAFESLNALKESLFSEKTEI